MKDKSSIELAPEYVRGQLHRHHNCSYHARDMKHDLPYHLAISKTIFEQPSAKTKTTLGHLVFLIQKALSLMGNYEVSFGPVSAGIIRYLVHNRKDNRVYQAEIGINGSYKCSCPASMNSSLPCKHIIFLALCYEHEINLEGLFKKEAK